MIGCGSQLDKPSAEPAADVLSEPIQAACELVEGSTKNDLHARDLQVLSGTPGPHLWSSAVDPIDCEQTEVLKSTPADRGEWQS